MAGDDVSFLDGFLEMRGYGFDDERVRETVETVFAELVVGGNFLVDGVGADVFGDCGVEGGVEVGNVCGVGEEVGDGLDDC